MKRFATSFVTVWLLTVGSSLDRISSALAQQTGSTRPTTETPEAEAAEPSETDQPQKIDVDASGIGVATWPSGVQRNVPGYWSMMSVGGVNRTDSDTEEIITAWIGDRSHLQFARKFWIPAGATRRAWLPVRIPDELTQDVITLPLSSIHLKESERGEQFQINYLDMPTTRRSMLISWEQSRSGVMLEPIERHAGSDQLVLEIGDMIYAGRDSAVVEPQDLGMVHLDIDFLPPTLNALDPYDQIIIANDRVLSDSAAASRIRSWLRSGGRVWIMVDRVTEETIQTLLGDAARFGIVDRVEVNQFDHERVDPFQGTVQTDPWSSETPATLVRVFADSEEVHSRINGWPTAFWIPVGRGEVLFTTLSSNGWLQDQQPTQTYTLLSNRFFIQRLPGPNETAKMVPFLEDEIGYNIPTRAAVAGILGCHMLLVLAAGAWLARRRALHQLAVVVPVAALLAAGSLVAMGKQKTASIPSTIALGQIARATADSSEVQVESIAAIYSQESREQLGISADHNTNAELMDESTGEVRRIRWDDSGQSTWMFVSQPPGVVRHVASESILSMKRPWGVQGRFNERGFVGQISGLNPISCEDAVIVSAASPSMSVNLQSDSGGSISSGFDDVLQVDQYIDDALMTDVQQARQQLLRKLITPESSLVSSEPSLLVWTPPIHDGVDFDQDFSRRGSLLASIPIQMERLSSGSRFKVPAGFVRLDSYAAGRGISLLYNPQTGKWIDKVDKPAEAELRCVPPKVLLPCKLDKATVRIKVNAPFRTLELKGFVDGEFVTLHTDHSPTGLRVFEIDRPEALQLDAEGGFLISIAISPTEDERRAATDPKQALPEEERRRSFWQIDYVHVNLEGMTL